MALVLIVLASLTLTYTRAQGSVYYVSTTGSDTTGNGSSANPWATVTYAVNAVPDGSTILVKPGIYNGRVRLDRVFTQGIIVRSEAFYRAQLRNNATVVTGFYGKKITLEGFDIAHGGPGAGALVIQIQDLIGASGGADFVSDIIIRNNVIHDSYNNDLLKINNGAGQITVEGNLFYNQSDSDEHIDINSVTDVVVQDNIFFNDFAGSGRTNYNDTSSYIVVKDSNDNDDTNLGSDRITVKRNVFFNWEGSTGSYFVLVGEDGKPYFEAKNVTVENNLMIGNSSNVIRAAFGVKGGQNVTFRNNTVVGNLPALAFALRLNTEGSNPPNENIRFYNNIWSDFTGTMGADNSGSANDFSDTPVGETTSFVINRNLYWNNGMAIPSDGAELINYTNDSTRLVSNPLLPSQSELVLPRWNSSTNRFNDGSTTVRQAFERLVTLYGVPSIGSPAIEAADSNNSPLDDIWGRARPSGSAPDLGAYEVQQSTGSTALFTISRNGVVSADGAYFCGKVSGCFNASIGADIAERVDASEALELGDVIEIDPNHPKRFRRARSATLVVGVIASKPGFVLGNSQYDDRPAIALVGRTYVKISLENGPIRSGDLLTLSRQKPGYAARCALPCLAPIIGKALQSGENTLLLVEALVMRP